MSKSFRELQEATDVTADELKDSLKDYAESGAAVLGRVVNGIIDRVSLSREDLLACLDSSEAGIATQRRVCSSPQSNEKNAGEYAVVAAHIKARLGGEKN